MCAFPGSVYSSDLRANMIITFREWQRFQTDPLGYAEETASVVPGWTVGRARAQLADPQFEPTKGEHTLLTPAAASGMIESDLLFYQHAFVCVTANKGVLSPSEARIHLVEPWRFRVMVNVGDVMVAQPVDYGSFKCQHCRQFAKYQFCSHCVVVGTLQREGKRASTDCIHPVLSTRQ